jgi:hypothetical protein
MLNTMLMTVRFYVLVLIQINPNYTLSDIITSKREFCGEFQLIIIYYFCTHFTILFFSFLIWPLIPAHFRCGRLLLCLITRNDTHKHWVGLLWTKDRQATETSTWHHKTLKEKNVHASVGIRTHIPRKRTIADPRLGQRGRGNRPL